MAGDKELAIDSLISRLGKEVEIRVEGSDAKFLGMNIEHDPASRILPLSNGLMIQELLKTFHMEQCSVSKTTLPCDDETRSKSKIYDTSHPHRELIGSLLYFE